MFESLKDAFDNYDKFATAEFCNNYIFATDKQKRGQAWKRVYAYAEAVEIPRDVIKMQILDSEKMQRDRHWEYHQSQAAANKARHELQQRTRLFINIAVATAVVLASVLIS
jgi:hypothetical protein